ncbi:hypothetical protein H2198_003505, partial [Neophaeococcomyces mojaviensis]
GQYLMPIDGKEQERLDMMHTMILAATPRHLRLHHAPFRPLANPETGEWPRVLDLGPGTGIWMMDMAEKYGKVEFIGMDLHNMGPPGEYHNVEFHTPRDYESPWAMGDNSFDLIHLQMGLGSVANWPRLYEKIFRHLKPGAWFEHAEIDWTPRSDDGSLPQGRFQEWWNLYVSPPYGAAGRPITYNPDTQALLQQKGFVNVQHFTYKIPTNGWSSNQAMHVSGTWWENAMGYGEGRGHGFEALSLAVLTRFQQWPPEHARKLCEEAIIEASNPSVHAYNNLHVYIAQRPPR